MTPPNGPIKRELGMLHHAFRLASSHMKTPTDAMLTLRIVRPAYPFPPTMTKAELRQIVARSTKKKRQSGGGEYLTVKEAAKLLGVSEQAVYRRVNSLWKSAVKRVGRSVRLDPVKLKRLL